MEALSRASVERFISFNHGKGDGVACGSGLGDAWRYDCYNGRGYGQPMDVVLSESVIPGDGYLSGYSYGDGMGMGCGKGYGSSAGDGLGGGGGAEVDLLYGENNGHGNGCGYADCSYTYFLEDERDVFGLTYKSALDYADGYPYSSGFSLKDFMGMPVYLIDGKPVCITSIHGRHAMGYLIRGGYKLERCHIAKDADEHGHLAIGKTRSKAENALYPKRFVIREAWRIDAFVKDFKADTYYPIDDLLGWHRALTASSENEIAEAVRIHGIDVNGVMTVKEFLALAEKIKCGRSTIRKLNKFYP